MIANYKFMKQHTHINFCNNFQKWKDTNLKSYVAVATVKSFALEKLFLVDLFSFY